MPVVRKIRFTRRDAEANPDTLFLFGDNLRKLGTAGQACVRGRPNAIGVPTKRLPSMARDAFFSDADFDQVRPLIQVAFAQAERHLEAGKAVVIAADGIGTGLAQLPLRAPRIAGLIDNLIKGLEARHGVRTAPD
jgi:hypothetical protein